MNEDNVNEEAEEVLVGKVDEAKHLPVNLAACSESPEAFSPEAYAQLEHHFAKALNSGKCPCESGKNFADCCKPMWMMARRSWQNKGDVEKEARKEEHKRDLDEMEKASKEEKGVEWVLRVGINKKTGHAVVGPLAKPGSNFHIGLAKRLCLEAWEFLAERVVQMQIEQTLMEISKQATKPKSTGAPFGM